MQPFTVHWSIVSSDATKRQVTDNSVLFALWPSPVNPDVCFKNAGFTDFGDGDEDWEENANSLLTRLLDELKFFGDPHLRSMPVKKKYPWYKRPFVQPEKIDVREQIELLLHRDDFPDCVVAFGNSNILLQVGSGHHIFWITIPEKISGNFTERLRHIADKHPLIRTDSMKWSCLLPRP